MGFGLLPTAAEDQRWFQLLVQIDVQIRLLARQQHMCMCVCVFVQFVDSHAKMNIVNVSFLHVLEGIQIQIGVWLIRCTYIYIYIKRQWRGKGKEDEAVCCTEKATNK